MVAAGFLVCSEAQGELVPEQCHWHLVLATLRENVCPQPVCIPWQVCCLSKHHANVLLHNVCHGIAMP